MLNTDERTYANIIMRHSNMYIQLQLLTAEYELF